MYRIILSLICLVIVTFCGDHSEKRIKEQVITIAENYVRGHLSTSERQTSGEGIVILSDGGKKYYIDPATLFTGLIDDDSREDALITIVSYVGTTLGIIEHLIIIQTDDGLTMQRSYESDMKILDLKDRIITAELPTHPRSSPLYDCPDCREVVRYRYNMGELVKME